MSEEFGSSTAMLSSESAALDLLGTMLDNASNESTNNSGVNMPPDYDDLDQIVFMPAENNPGTASRQMRPLAIAAITAAGLIALTLGGFALVSRWHKTSQTEVAPIVNSASLDFDVTLGLAEERLSQIGSQFSNTNATLVAEQQKRIAEMEAERAAEEAAAAEEETSDDTTDYYVDDTTYETDYSETTYYYTYDDDNSTDADSEDASTVENVTPVEDTSQTADSDQAQEVTYDDATESTEVSDTAGLEQDDQALATNI